MKCSWKQFIEIKHENFVLQLFVADTMIEHQEKVVKNMMKHVMIIDTLVYYWMSTTITNNELLKIWRTVIR